MEYTIERVKLGDETALAYIQTESWKAGFKNILSTDVLQRCTQIDKVTAMYRRLLEQNIGNGYLLKVEGNPHCIAWWDATREKNMPGYAELICIHSLQDKWRKGYGSKMMLCYRIFRLLAFQRLCFGFLKIIKEQDDSMKHMDLQLAER